MKIVGVDALPFTFWHDREPLSYCLLRIVTEDGHTGFGEACDSFGCTYASVVETLVADAYAPLLIGEELDVPDRLVDKIRSWTRRRLGTHWVNAYALSGVELALYDAIGHTTGQSVATILNGTTEPVTVYASSVFLEEGPAKWHVDLLQPLLDAGVKAAKLRIGVDWKSDLETLAGIRAILGDDMALMVDGNENFTVDTALNVANKLADLGVDWFEEPIPQEFPEAIEAVADRSPVAIAYGEHMFGQAAFTEAIRRGWASIYQPDVATCGGLSEGIRIANLAEELGVQVVPHTASGPIALSANLHFASALPSIDLLEYPYPLADCWKTIAPNCPLGPAHINDGKLTPPTGLGFGVEIDLQAVAERPYQPPAPRFGVSSRFMGNV